MLRGNLGKKTQLEGPSISPKILMPRNLETSVKTKSLAWNKLFSDYLK